ncbi:MAG: hypothetical protein KJZ60_12820 [Ignavibacteriaceae bacterium]|nr:hypothetical protein [Ignavibacteriaceae bacterium]
MFGRKMINIMNISILIVSLLNFVGCYSSEKILKEDIINGISKPDPKEEIFITTMDSIKYHFNAYNYQLLNDTIYGQGKSSKNGIESPFDGKNSVDHILIIEQNQADTGTTTGLILGIMAVGVVAAGLLILALMSDVFNPD